MEALQFIYDENTIDFLSSDDNVMVNATQMAKLFGKQVVAFTRNDDTKKFITQCLKSENSHFIGIKSEADLIDSRQKSGTFMHRILALKFAAWLDPEFELWVWMTIDKILLGHYKELKDATIEKLEAERQLKEKKEKLIQENPQIAEIFELELKISKADKKRLKAIKESTMQLKFNLFPQEN